LVLLALGIWLNAADTLVAATIMPSVGRDLGGHAWFGWATAGFLLGAIVAGASAGRMSEVLGLRRAMVVAGITFAVGCLFGALAGGRGGRWWRPRCGSRRAAWPGGSPAGAPAGGWGPCLARGGGGCSPKRGTGAACSGCSRARQLCSARRRRGCWPIPRPRAA